MTDARSSATVPPFSPSTSEAPTPRQGWSTGTARSARSCGCRRRYSTDGTGDAVLAQLVVLADGFAERHPDVVPEAAGLIVPGLVDDEAGIGRVRGEPRLAGCPLPRQRDGALSASRWRSPTTSGPPERPNTGSERPAPTATSLVVVIGTGIAERDLHRRRTVLGLRLRRRDRALGRRPRRQCLRVRRKRMPRGDRLGRRDHPSLQRPRRRRPSPGARRGSRTGAGRRPARGIRLGHGDRCPRPRPRPGRRPPRPGGHRARRRARPGRRRPLRRLSRSG